MTSVTGKNKLREQALALRASLDTAAISEQICKHIEAWEIFQLTNNILAYWALAHEISISTLIKKYPEKNWYLPRILPGKLVVFHQYQVDDSLEENKFGIPEPLSTAPEWSENNQNYLVFVPALMIDTHGGRLGFGQGYYDRFLAALPSKIPTATPMYQKLLTPGLPQDSWDVPIQFAITEAGLIPLR